MGHTLRGAVSAWLALIVLQTVVTNSGQASGALGAINNLLQRALSPDVPAIPDRRSGAHTAAAAGGFPTMTAAQYGQVVADAKTAQAIQKANEDPSSLISQLSNMNLTGLGPYRSTH